MQAMNQGFILDTIKDAEKQLIANGCMTTDLYLKLLECERLLSVKAGRKPKAKQESEG